MNCKLHNKISSSSLFTFGQWFITEQQKKKKTGYNLVPKSGLLLWLSQLHWFRKDCGKVWNLGWSNCVLRDQWGVMGSWKIRTPRECRRWSTGWWSFKGSKDSMGSFVWHTWEKTVCIFWSAGPEKSAVIKKRLDQPKENLVFLRQLTSVVKKRPVSLRRNLLGAHRSSDTDDMSLLGADSSSEDT